MTYLQIVNEVLARLREASVASVTTNSYSALIGKFVNDTKRQVEDAWNWDALNTAIDVTTAAGTSNYTVTGSGYRFKVDTVNDITSQGRLFNAPIAWIKDQQQLSTVQNGAPTHYAFNGVSSGDSKVELFPTPDGVYTVRFNLYVPQADLSADGDVLTIPTEAVIAGAYARALVERGEDGGLSSSEAYNLFKGIMADQIAIESSRFGESSSWVCV